MGHIERDAYGNDVYQRLDFEYSSSGQVLKERGRQKQGADWLYSHSVYYYNDTGWVSGSSIDPPDIASAAAAGSSSGQVMYFSETKQWHNGGWEPVYVSSADTALADTYSKYGYQWVDQGGDSSARQSYHELANRYGTTYSNHLYDGAGHLAQVARTGASRRRAGVSLAAG